MDLSSEEERLHRAYRLGCSDGRGDYPGGRGLDLILMAVQSEEHLEGFLETTEQRLERELEEERKALQELKRPATPEEME